MIAGDGMMMPTGAVRLGAPGTDDPRWWDVPSERHYKVVAVLNSIPGGPVNVIAFNVVAGNLYDEGRKFDLKVVAECGLVVTLATATRTTPERIKWQLTRVISELAILQDKTVGWGKTPTIKAKAKRAVARKVAQIAMMQDEKRAEYRTETGWIIERPPEVRHGHHAMYIRGLRVVGDGPGRILEEWTFNSQQALRFAREDDANRFIADMDHCNLTQHTGWRPRRCTWHIRAEAAA